MARLTMEGLFVIADEDRPAPLPVRPQMQPGVGVLDQTECLSDCQSTGELRRCKAETVGGCSNYSMGLKCHLPLTHRQGYQRAGACTWSRGAGCQLPDTSLGVSMRHRLTWAALEAPEVITVLEGAWCLAWGGGGHKA